jgi:hypothetical protein
MSVVDSVAAFPCLASGIECVRQLEGIHLIVAVSVKQSEGDRICEHGDDGLINESAHVGIAVCPIPVGKELVGVPYKINVQCWNEEPVWRRHHKLKESIVEVGVRMDTVWTSLKLTHGTEQEHAAKRLHLQCCRRSQGASKQCCPFCPQSCLGA